MNIKHKTQSILVLAVTIIWASCTGDLNTLPLNDNDFTSEKAYTNKIDSYLEGLAKIYSGFCAVGQGGPNGSADINVEDGGSSELIRMWWSLNEFSTDEVKCAWKNDSYVREMNFNTWTNANNFAVFVVYNRFMLGATLANEYLRQTSDDKLKKRGCDDALIQKIHQLRDEARYIRAYMYWIGIDMFGDIPFVTENDPIGTFMPPQKTRTEVFEYIENELKSLATSGNLPEIGTANYPRIDKGAVYGLLSRLYLNSKIYTGTERWQEAMDAAKQIIVSNKYQLAPNYDELFRSDNGQNPKAQQELIFAIDYDKNNTISFGGTRFLSCAAIGSDDLADHVVGVDGGWGGIRTNIEYVNKFFPDVKNPNYETGKFTYTDKRAAAFYIKNRTPKMEDWREFLQGWSVFKFNAVPSTYKGNEAAFGNKLARSDIDYPLIRLGEIYMTYVEAAVRKGSLDALALKCYNDIRSRAGYTNSVGTFSLDDVYMERTRELMWEGFRRIDLIRFNLYTSSAYRWAYKGGVADGQAFGDYKRIFPIPVEDLAANSNLKPTPGY